MSVVTFGPGVKTPKALSTGQLKRITRNNKDEHHCRKWRLKIRPKIRSDLKLNFENGQCLTFGGFRRVRAKARSFVQ